jgi:hypothetical protein
MDTDGLSRSGAASRLLAPICSDSPDLGGGGPKGPLEPGPLAAGRAGMAGGKPARAPPHAVGAAGQRRPPPPLAAPGVVAEPTAPRPAPEPAGFLASLFSCLGPPQPLGEHPITA